MDQNRFGQMGDPPRLSSAWLQPVAQRHGADASSPTGLLLIVRHRWTRGAMPRRPWHPCSLHQRVSTRCRHLRAAAESSECERRADAPMRPHWQASSTTRPSRRRSLRTTQTLPSAKWCRVARFLARSAGSGRATFKAAAVAIDLSSVRSISAALRHLRNTLHFPTQCTIHAICTAYVQQNDC